MEPGPISSVPLVMGLQLVFQSKCVMSGMRTRPCVCLVALLPSRSVSRTIRALVLCFTGIQKRKKSPVPENL